MSDQGFFDGHKSHQRGKDKIEQVVRWLAMFDYSDRQTIARMLGVSAVGQAAFFQKLPDTGFFSVEPVPGMRRALFSLTDTGHEYASMLSPDVVFKRRKRMPAWIYLVHSLSIQAAVLNRGDSVRTFRTEKTLGGLKATHVPDAVVCMEDGTDIALEVELSQKSNGRIYHIFLAHLRNMSEGHYKRVMYLFNNDGLAQLYRAKFEATKWPIYRIDPKTHKLGLDATRTFDATGVIERQTFTFAKEPLYDL